jgi:hypothetical protein
MLAVTINLYSADKKLIESIDEKYLNYRIESNDNVVKYSSRLLLLESKSIPNLKLILIYSKNFEISKDLSSVDTNDKYFIGIHYKY